MPDRGSSSFPASHADALAGVLRVVDLIAARPEIDDDEIVKALIDDGVAPLDAELLVRFVPIAFAFALLKHMGISRFPSTFGVYDERDHLVEMPLATEHFFSAALGLGHEVTTHGYSDRIRKETFLAITMRSAEMNAVNQALEAGHAVEDLARATISPPILLGVTLELIAASRGTRDRVGSAKRWWQFWGRQNPE